MSEIYTVIVVILGILAVSGLFVGVSNDAVNFLNSAIGSKAAPMKTILRSPRSASCWVWSPQAA